MACEGLPYQRGGSRSRFRRSIVPSHPFRRRHDLVHRRRSILKPAGCSRPVAVIHIGRHKSSMRLANRTLLGLCLCASTAGCDAYLRLEILNATEEGFNVVVEGRDARVAPGLSYSGRYPSGGSTITIRTTKCSRDYTTPELDQSPWKYLIGRSVKLRAVSSGDLIAYPPTPDVEIKGNPLRAMQDGAVILHPLRATCRQS